MASTAVVVRVSTEGVSRRVGVTVLRGALMGLPPSAGGIDVLRDQIKEPVVAPSYKKVEPVGDLPTVPNLPKESASKVIDPRA